MKRFWDKVEKTKTCWIWKANKSGGYGRFRFGGKYEKAHRISWIFKNGVIPSGLCVCHRCDNPSCVKPSHLFLATHAENMADMVKKNRQKFFVGEKHPLAKINNKMAKLIYESSGEYREIGDKFGISPTTVWRIKKRISWSHIT